VPSEGCHERGDPCAYDGTGLAEALLGLSRLRVLAVGEGAGVIEIGTMVHRPACARCGTWAQPHEGMEVAIRGLPCFGRPARLVWRKQRAAVHRCRL
jgi:hypothetical protein